MVSKEVEAMQIEQGAGRSRSPPARHFYDSIKSTTIRTTNGNSCCTSCLHKLYSGLEGGGGRGNNDLANDCYPILAVSILESHTAIASQANRNDYAVRDVALRDTFPTILNSQSVTSA